VDGNDGDNGSQGLLPCGGGGSGNDDDDIAQSALFDLEQLLFPNSDDVSGTCDIAVKEETHDVTGITNGGLHGGNVGAAPLGMTSSWPLDSVAAIKMEEGGFNAAAPPTAAVLTAGVTAANYGVGSNSCGVLDLDNCFSELFPDLAVAEAGIVM